MVTATRTGRPAGLKRSKVPKRWRKILCAIPGYDPFRDSDECWFEPDMAESHIEYIETCCSHIEGALAGQPFILELWQKAIVANLFGWYMTDFLGRPCRRFTKCLLYVPRKNGKTPLVAAIHNDLFFNECDHVEAGQINNLAAGSRDQASKLFRHISGMIRNEPEMEKRCRIYTATKSITKGDESVTKVIPADESTAHGDNPYFQAIDELHVQANERLYGAMTTAMASANRVSQLLLMSTTADYDRPSVCNSEHAYAVKVRDGIIPDARYLPVIYEADKDDDWTHPDTWYKANPNLGVSVSLDHLQSACLKAKENPEYENTFKRLHLNIRTEQAERVIPMADWDECANAFDDDLRVRIEKLGRTHPGAINEIWEDKFAKCPCWAALDIGALSDFVSLVLVWGDERGEPVAIDYEDLRGEEKQWQFVRRDYWLQHFCWLPEKPPSRDPRMEAHIDAWSRQGLIIRTPGDVVDYDQVTADLTRIIKPYGLTQLAIDQGFQGMQITQDLQKIFGEERVVAFRQGIISMAAPFRELMQLIMLRRLHHDGNPVLRWMASNVAAESRGGLMKPSKDKSTEKIDGITAATMAIGIAMTAAPPRKSVYAERGITFL